VPLVLYSAVIFVGLLCLLFIPDGPRLNPAQEVAAASRFSLVQWEVTNFLDKWANRLARELARTPQDEDVRLGQVREYFALVEQTQAVRRDLAAAAAGQGGDVAALEVRLEELEERQAALQDDVEETLESTISAVLRKLGLASVGGFIFPPVDIRLGEPPKLLVSSPRERIERTHDVLLHPGVGIQKSESMESSLLTKADLSALVVEIGGVATYPASVLNNRPLRSTLQVASHEWLHHYLAFRPLGWNFYTSADMQTLNETFADVAGREIGDLAYILLGGSIEPESSTGAEVPPPQDQEAEGFDFAREMRATRAEVDALLASGQVARAEAYMEQRRQLFVENGYPIRKLNQAYFAFHGTYAESPTSASPIGEQLREFRRLSENLYAFIRSVPRFSNYGQFLAELERIKRLQTGDGSN